MQWPNAALWVYIGATALRVVVDGDLSRRVGVIGTIALVAWAVLEVLRGANPFRRSLGAMVLIGVFFGF